MLISSATATRRAAKPFYVITDTPSVRPITKYNYFNIQLHPLSSKEGLYVFRSKEALEELVKATPGYYVHPIGVEEVLRYCYLTKSDLKVVRRCFCDIASRTTRCDISCVYEAAKQHSVL
jgi:hypothetical protein